MQIVDLTDGAKIRFHTADDPTGPPGVYDETDGLFRKRTASEWYSYIRTVRSEEGTWDYLFPSPGQLFSTTNATFFTDTRNERNTTVPFPIYTAHGRASLGLAYRRGHEAGGERDADYNAPKRAFLLRSVYEEGVVQKARVGEFPTHYPEPFEIETEEPIEEWLFFESIGHAGGIPEESDTEEYAVGLAPEYVLGAEGESNRRNYLGVYGSIVDIFTSNYEYTNAQMRSIMQEIQPGMEVVQMDGGGSASFYSAYGEMDSSIPIIDRKVPNVLAVYTAR